MSAAKRALRILFEAGQRLGLDVLPRHFYSEIPDVRRLTASTEWRRPFSMAGVRGAGIEAQTAFLEETCARAGAAAVDGGLTYRRACEANGEPGYGPVEAAFLHQFVAAWQPARILQIGCGVSTAVCRAAR